MNVEQKWDLGGGQTDQFQYNSQNYSTWHNRERMVRGTWKKLIASFSTSSPANAANTKEEESRCAICLDPLNYCTSAVFTAKCGHAFHFSCISSYVAHGGLTCPICRAHLPRSTNEPLPVRHHHRLRVDLCPRPTPALIQSSAAAYDVCVRLENPPPTDLVLVATPTPTAPYLGQAMALVILSLRPQDRLSIVAHPARISPLTPMTPAAKQTALQLIHQSFFHSHNQPRSPAHALNKGIQVLHDRVYTNPQSHILHLSHHPPHLEGGVHCYHVGCGFLLHRFQQFLTRMLRGAATQIQIKMDGRIIQVGELRGGQHRKLPLLLPKCGPYCAEYSYIDGGTTKVTGEMFIRIQSDAHYDGSRRDFCHGNKTAQVFTWKYLHSNSLLLASFVNM